MRFSRSRRWEGRFCRMKLVILTICWVLSVVVSFVFLPLPFFFSLYCLFSFLSISSSSQHHTIRKKNSNYGHFDRTSHLTKPPDELHLTRVDGVVQMRPQFHHVDAITHAETAARRTEASETNPTTGTSTTATTQKAPQALALAQTYKDNRDVENLEALRAKNLLLIAAEEKWTRLEYFDEDEEASYETYHSRLFHGDVGGAKALKSQMKNEEYLDAISAPRVDPSGRKKKRPLTKKQMERIEAAEDDVEGAGEMGGEVEVEMS
jgi:hypothetical protein